MVGLMCFIVGKKRHSGFGVKIDSNNTVGQLKEAIKKQIPSTWKVEAEKLQLFLAKKDGEWLNTDRVAAVRLDIHGHPPGFEPMVSSQLLKSDKVFGGADYQRSRGRYHVLVVVPSGITIKIGEAEANSELKLYEERGEMIQNNCKDYCNGILEKIEALYERSSDFPIPFLCVEGSSGMGKTQVAFALGGNRPWFYWPVASIGSTSNSQLLNDNFTSLSSAFDKVTRMDDPMNKADYDILGSCSPIYDNELWAYGFIRALLQYCSSADTRTGVMLRFEEELPVYVDKCDLKTVKALRDQMKADGKLLPFFVLDEMTPSEEAGGEKLAAFQRNIFCTCGLVVVVMGKDPKMTNLTFRTNTRGDRTYFLTIFSRFPPFQPMPFTDAEKQDVWGKIQHLYPILKNIQENSRGRFARIFKESVVEYVRVNPDFNLCDLLDEAFLQVQLKTHSDVNFTKTPKDPYAQMMAISYENADPSCLDDETDGLSGPPAKRRKTGVDSSCMESHCANLLVNHQSDIDTVGGHLLVPSGHGAWLQHWCRFPTIDEDLLLYLSVLGGKTHPAYYDGNTTRSVFQVFSTYVQQLRHSSRSSSDTVHIQNPHEDMVIHMIFCASRRNGVRGIRFEDFFPCLLGEFQDGAVRKAMAIEEDVKTVRMLLEGYGDLSSLLDVTIPFLSPPNAQWPQFILETRESGCNFGHFVRLEKSLCVYEQSVSVAPLLLCECNYCNVDMSTMNEMIKRLDSTWKEEKEWKMALLFCVKLADPLQSPWERTDIDCVKINCQAWESSSCQVTWVFQPDEGARKKLVVVLETGSLH